ncbi:Universal stress protein [Caulifigura coniformis]|uniref:Universal stress protein n=1 Tax=Caulifigura coniformis TaxID=2527983 RepID=A0A517SKL0_9PLAN|nr:universal stress protein [Caulifigura coniformis]QDT56665.1 Universal stress protein [Caulifigura coniformis]
MSGFQHVLVPVDFSAESIQALHYGCAFARNDKAPLSVLHAVQNLAPLTFGGAEVVSNIAVQYADEAEANARKALENVVPAEWMQGLEIRREAVVGATAETILDYARSHQVDLIVVGTHGRGGVTRMLLGSVAEKIVQRAPCSVLVVRQREHEFVTPGSELPRPQNVLVPIDFSDRGQKALEEGADLAARFGAELHLLHVVEDTTPATSELATTSSVFRAYMRELTTQGEKQVEDVQIPNLGVSVVQRKVVIGSPIARITAYAAEKEIDLIVMGTHGRTGAMHWLLGSVAERVVRSAPCPVMVCRRTADDPAK